MSLVYNINKSKDLYKLEVSQDTSFKLFYTSNNNEELISEKILTANSSTTLNTLKDGMFIVKLNAENEEEQVEKIIVTKYLQNSIVSDVLNILCNCNQDSSNCSKNISYQDKKILKNKNIFNKILSYQNLYIPRYGDNYMSTFSKFLGDSTILTKCNIQNDINNISFQEIITGSDKYNEKLFKTYLYLYWIGIYFIEKSLIDTSNIDEFEYLKQKFKFVEITNCSCDLCFNLEELENSFNTTVNITEIYSFQLDDISEGMDDIVNSNYNLQEYTEEQLIEGVEITYSKIGKIGFLIKNKEINLYLIKDSFGVNITEISFDYLYQDGVSYYLTKEYISFSTIYFKFTKNN